jgi:hypothetical protein
MQTSKIANQLGCLLRPGETAPDFSADSTFA